MKVIYCQAKRGGRTCYGPLYRCKKCGHIGCQNPDCPQKGFKMVSGPCVICGGFGEPIK